MKTKFGIVCVVCGFDLCDDGVYQNTDGSDGLRAFGRRVYLSCLRVSACTLCNLRVRSGQCFGGRSRRIYAYAPVTLVVKCFMALLFALCFRKRKNWLNIVGAVVATIWMALGYFVYEVILYGVPVSAANIPFNLIQGGVCGAVAMPIAYTAKKQWCTVRTKISCKYKNK